MGSSVAVVPGPRTSFLDHLMPLCYLMQIPIHCSDPWVETCAAQFYPEPEIVKGDLSPYHTFYVVEPCRLYGNALQFGPFVKNGLCKTVAGFHGNPDKFRDIFWIERYLDEDVVLVYGQHLMDYLKEKGIWERLKKTVRIGNIRYAYYKHHRDFFDRIVAPHLIPDKSCKTILWAPTWSYSRSLDDSPFFELYPYVFDSIPEGYRMVVKLHPYTFRLFPDKVAHIKATYEHVHFLDEIPLVYPFLSQVDIFLGDYSSVAYDFLSFNRPLFFFGKKKVEWGVTVHDIRRLFRELEQPDRLASAREKAYAYVFGEDIPFEEIKKRL